MPVDEGVLRNLQEMGIDEPLARAAAERFSNVDAAVNWCFGDGANWKPEAEELPDYQPTTSRHRGPERTYGSRRSPRAQLGSNNPFRSSPQPEPIEEDDDELQKAIALSQSTEDDDRAVRERSVRASGVPPPSPEPEIQEVSGPVFGPSNKDDKDGKMALVPASQPAQTGNEDDDFHRAVADSLMTASYHSASAQRDIERPSPEPRQDGAPVVLYSQSGNSTYAANLLQGLFAIPQLREAVMTSVNDELDPEAYMRYTLLQELSERMQTTDRSFLEVDEVLREIRGGEPCQLPPAIPIMAMHEQLWQLLYAALRSAKTPSVQASNPDRLFHSSILGDYPTTSPFVHFSRLPDLPLEIYPALATVLWSNDTPGQMVDQFSDILTVRLDWAYGSPRELWKLQDRIVLDRFLRENAARTAQVRAQQGVALGSMKRLKDKIEELSMHKGNNYHDSIRTLIKHLDLSPAPTDEIGMQSRAEMKAKLEAILEALKAKTANLEAELEKESKAAGPEVFETDDPSLNHHAYLLRAVLMHDGALVAGSHLYVYVRQDDGVWWKIKEHEASKVDWDEIVNDRTGLFMDGGPYLLLYSREGDRPESAEKDLISFDTDSDRTESKTSGYTSRTSRSESPIKEPSAELGDGNKNGAVGDSDVVME